MLPPLACLADFAFGFGWRCSQPSAGAPAKCEGAAQGKSPHALGWPSLWWQRSNPCFQWRRNLTLPHYQAVHNDITFQCLVEQNGRRPIYIDGTGAHAYSPLAGMALRWMADGSGVNWHLHLTWRCLLLVAPIQDHMDSCTMYLWQGALDEHMQEFRFLDSCHVGSGRHSGLCTH